MHGHQNIKFSNIPLGCILVSIGGMFLNIHIDTLCTFSTNEVYLRSVSSEYALRVLEYVYSRRIGITAYAT